MNRRHRQTARLREGLLVVTIDNEGLLLDVAKKCYYSLNDTAAFILKQLENNVSPLSLLRRLMAEYKVEAATAKADVDTFLNLLLKHELITLEEGTATITEPEEGLNVEGGRNYQPPRIELEAEIRTVIGQLSLNRVLYQFPQQAEIPSPI
ncbi:MAG: PqqD family protein [Candidatus Nezhaarchaeota archaeon]|nr:PqqD family protein [Candidatus Nezhaarchaeota archaeon]